MLQCSTSSKFMHAPSLSPAADGSETSRGALSRERMLRAAVDQFGRHGFDGTTTRMVAQAADMNLGAIPYYFGSKDDLYLGAVDFLADFINAKQVDALNTLRDLASATTDAHRLIDLVVDFLTAQARHLLADDVPSSWVQFFMRVQGEAGPAFDRLYQRVVEPTQREVDTLVARICGSPADTMLPYTVTFLAWHQVFSFRLSDTILLRRMGWPELNNERIDQLLHLIARLLRAQLEALVPPSSKP